MRLMLAFIFEKTGFCTDSLLGTCKKMTTDTLTMTSNDQQIVTQTGFLTALFRLDQQCNRIRTKTNDKKKK